MPVYHVRVEVLERKGGKGAEKMRGQREAVQHANDHSVLAKIGNAADCRKSIRATIAKRAYEIYQRQGSRPGHDQQNWRCAESEILQPLTCGILQSKNEVIVSSFCSAMGAKNLQGSMAAGPFQRDDEGHCSWL